MSKMSCVKEINSIFSKSHSETDDFVNSAKQNPDVFLDHSTLLNIEQEDKSTHGNVTLTFNVGKDNLEVNTNYIINLSSSHLCSLVTGACPRSSLAPFLRVWPELVQRVPRGQPRSVRPQVWSAITRRCLHLTDSVTITATWSHVSLSVTSNVTSLCPFMWAATTKCVNLVIDEINFLLCCENFSWNKMQTDECYLFYCFIYLDIYVRPLKLTIHVKIKTTLH